MDAALQRAHREALAEPESGERRAAYARALLRAGRRVAAARETYVAWVLGGDAERWVPVEAPEVVGGEPRRWYVDLDHAAVLDDLKAVAPPDLPDARWPGACLRRGDEAYPQPLPLVLVPRRPCRACGGVGCGPCHGSGVATPEVEPPAGGCAHEGLGRAAIEHRLADQAPPPKGGPSARVARRGVLLLVRCKACGLAALRSGGSTKASPACAACGLLACDGDCARVFARGRS